MSMSAGPAYANSQSRTRSLFPAVQWRFDALKSPWRRTAGPAARPSASRCALTNASTRGRSAISSGNAARSSPAVRALVERRGATLRYLPPYSHDFNPIEPAWGLVKKRIRAHAPRTARALRRVARGARDVVRPHHRDQWFAHAGHGNSSTFRD